MATTSARAEANGKRPEQQENDSRVQTAADEPVAEATPANADSSSVTSWFGWVSENLPQSDELAEAGRSVREHLSSPGRIAYYGGLGALAALSIVEWPVVMAIGVGTVVAQQTTVSGSGSPRSQRHEDS